MKFSILFLVLASLVFSGCKSKEGETTTSDIEENAQHIGDVMASVDESSGTTSGSYSYEKFLKKPFEKYAPNEIDQNLIAQLILPPAQAASCFAVSGTTYNACASGVITRTFNNCTVGLATISGDVTLTRTPLTCAGAGFAPLATGGDSISRAPNLTVTGRRGATLTISKPNTFGQRVAYSSGAGASRVFSFTNDGIKRVFIANGTTLLDMTSTVTSPITIQNATRSGRIVTGGSLRVTNNLTSVTCDYVPTNVTWGDVNCNCANSGSWTGNCSDNKSTTLNITGCGTATYTQGTDTTNVTFDRCGT